MITTSNTEARTNHEKKLSAHSRSDAAAAELPDRDTLVDDPGRIVQYRAVALAEGLKEGTEAEVLWAWQWLGDHPEVTNRLQGWFARRVAELRAMGRIK